MQVNKVIQYVLMVVNIKNKKLYSDNFNESKIKLLFVNTFCQTYFQQKTEVTEILNLILLL